MQKSNLPANTRLSQFSRWLQQSRQSLIKRSLDQGLVIGERLAVTQGETTIESIGVRVTAEHVYNLEVQGEHVYRVTNAGLLVHNSCVLLGEFMLRVRAAGAASGLRVWKLGTKMKKALFP